PVPRVVRGDELLTRRVGCAARRVPAVARARRPGTAPGDVHAARYDSRRDAHTGPARERRALDALRPLPGVADPGRLAEPGRRPGAGPSAAAARRPVRRARPRRHVGPAD